MPVLQNSVSLVAQIDDMPVPQTSVDEIVEMPVPQTIMDAVQIPENTNIEVLPVISQQLLVLFGKKTDMQSFNDPGTLMFEGTLITTMSTFHVFIFMNAQVFIFFKGLAFPGIACCFDEFDHISIEGFSVIAQQLLVLLGKKADMKSYNDTAILEFEGTLTIMMPTFYVFITMNLGYAGRAELPDNLAALFRPVAMMFPDHALIGQIMFYAYGFADARVFKFFQ
eukprot:386798-Amphidinium_carterae.1